MPRDVSKPYTPEEQAELMEFFRKLPTYNTEQGYCESGDLYQLASYMDYGTYAQVTNFKDFVDKHMGGKLTLEYSLECFQSFHDTAKLARMNAIQVDKDGNGFISQDEFAELLKIASFHNEKLKDVTFEDFVEDADTNKDGLVSIDECADWINKHVHGATC